MLTLKQAAYIVGSLGGRPRKYKHSYRGGGFIVAYTTEDLSEDYTDEFLNIYIPEN